MAETDPNPHISGGRRCCAIRTPRVKAASLCLLLLAACCVRSAPAQTTQVKLTASDATAEAWFGRSVAISGDTAIAGAEGDDTEEVMAHGSAYVFELESETPDYDRWPPPDGDGNINTLDLLLLLEKSRPNGASLFDFACFWMIL